MYDLHDLKQTNAEQMMNRSFNKLSAKKGKTQTSKTLRIVEVHIPYYIRYFDWLTFNRGTGDLPSQSMQYSFVSYLKIEVNIHLGYETLIRPRSRFRRRL